MPALPEILTQAFKTGEVLTPEGVRTPMHSNVNEEECLRLYETVREVRPDVSVEVGFAQGISTLAILQALRDNGRGHHHVIDPYQARFGNCGLAMVEKSGLGDRFTFYGKFAEEVIPSLPRLQFAFIDASHLFDLTLCEFVLADKRLDVGGVIGLHDLWMPSLQSVVRFVLGNRAYEVCGEEKPSAGGVRRAVAKIAARLPGAKRLFAREVLKPWGEFGLPNMVMLRKIGEDTRDWRHHVAF